jgi:hypothetical protein
VLQSIKQVTGCRILASDGEIGRIDDVYFDDEKWVVRYLIADPGSWLADRRVLISPHAVRLMDIPARAVAVALTREQVRNSPDIDTNQPVSRQQEEEYYRYYGYTAYWPIPRAAPVAERREGDASGTRDPRRSADTHLRSTREVLGYHIQATDDSIGHAEDFLFDDDTWAIQQLVVDTRNWLPGKHVLIGTQLLRDVDWLDRTLSVALDREGVRSSPTYDADHLPPSGDGRHAENLMRP